MIDLSLAKHELSKNEKYVIKWLNDNQFEGKIVNQYISKTIFEIKKDGIVEKFELPQGIENISVYMKQYQKNWNMLCELYKLNNLLK